MTWGIAKRMMMIRFSKLRFVDSKRDWKTYMVLNFEVDMEQKYLAIQIDKTTKRTLENDIDILSRELRDHIRLQVVDYHEFMEAEDALH